MDAHSILSSTAPHTIVGYGDLVPPAISPDYPRAVQKTSSTQPEGNGRETRTGASSDNSSAEADRALEKLRARDREVRSHEAAHLAAAGPYARSGPTFTYQRGPDGRLYAVGGEVDIDTSEVPGNPEATIQKAQAIRRSANAPLQPSAQDRQVAAEASAIEAKARRELLEERSDNSTGTGRASLSSPTHSPFQPETTEDGRDIEPGQFFDTMV